MDIEISLASKIKENPKKQIDQEQDGSQEKKYQSIYIYVEKQAMWAWS